MGSHGIFEFRGEFRFLSNFYPSPFTYAGIDWLHVEGAYQAAKAVNIIDAIRISTLVCPVDAKRAGRQIVCRPEWDLVKYDVMLELVTEKFIQNRTLATKLLDTGNAHIEEGNNHNDRVWGVCPPKSGMGRNWLGQILMQVRSNLLQTQVH